MIVIDKLCYFSKLRRVNPEEKFGFAVISLLICVISRSVTAALILFAVNGFLNVKKGEIPFLRYMRLLLIPFAFFMLSTAAIMIDFSKIPLDAYAIPVGQWFITGSREGMLRGMNLIVTAMSAVSCLYFLSLNTPMTEIMEVLKRVHCPAVFIELMLLTYRFIFILMEEADAVMTAQNARLGNRDFKTSLRSFGQMASMLFVRSLKKSFALYDSMEARCYDGKIQILREGQKAEKKEICLIICFECLLLLAACWRN